MENDGSQIQQPNSLIIHRLPAYDSSLFNHLSSSSSSSFSFIDPTSVVGSDYESYKNYLRSHAASAEALYCVGLTPLGKDTLDCLPSLKCVASSGVGVDHIDLVECRRRGINVVNVGHAFSDDVADCAVGLLIDVFRKVSGGHRFVRDGSWVGCPQFPLGFRLAGKRVGIVGLGSIGSRVAKRLVSFGCKIAYTSRSKKPSITFPYYETVHKLAQESDALVLCCTLTDQTRHMINKDVLTALGKEGVVINVGRGGLIDESEMVRFLVEGKLGGVGLDVFENEPSVPKELVGLENVVLSPHQAVLTPESLQAASDAVVANLKAFFSNKPLLTPVTWF